jgi:hypothetical protein
MLEAEFRYARLMSPLSVTPLAVTSGLRIEGL